MVLKPVIIIHEIGILNEQGICHGLCSRQKRSPDTDDVLIRNRSHQCFVQIFMREFVGKIKLEMNAQEFLPIGKQKLMGISCRNLII